MTAVLRSLLEGLVSTGGVLSEGEAQEWKTGGSGSKAVVAPATEEELAGILARAGEEGWRVMPAGQGTWLDGGGPGEVDLVVSTSRMNQIQKYEPSDLTFTAGAGISLSDLREATSTQGQWLPLDPPGGWEGSLGATVATGSWGPLRPLYGTPRDQVLGVTMVSGDGRILRWGGRVVKNVAGFDITRLCIGSWGTLGVITAVSARLFPLPQADETLVLSAPRAEALLSSARLAALSSFSLASVELVDPLPWLDPGQRSASGSRISGEFRGPGSLGSQVAGGKKGAGLILRLMGSRAQVEEMESRLRLGLGGGVGTALVRAAGEEARRLHEALAGWENGAELVFRLALLPSDLGVLLGEVRELKHRWEQGRGDGGPGLRVAAHASAGVLRVAAGETPAGGAELDVWARDLNGLRSRLEARGGSLTVSRGPGPLLEAVGPWGPPGPEGALMAGLKNRFDPHGTLVPGRLGV